MSRTEMMGCQFDAWTMQETLAQVAAHIENGTQSYLCTVNVSILMMMRDDNRLRDLIHASPMIVADGQPLIWASQLTPQPLPCRVTGVDLVSNLAELASQKKWGVYLLGATQDVVTDVGTKLKSSFPSLQLSGTHDGYFDDSDIGEIAADISASGARILIVAMGVPKQEFFIQRCLEESSIAFAIGVGGSFDVISGKTKRAPRWMQASGLEWLYRTLQEPRRLFKRYLLTNSRFLFLLARELVTGKFGKQRA